MLGELIRWSLGGICFVDEIPKSPSGMLYHSAVDDVVHVSCVPIYRNVFQFIGKILRRLLRDHPAKGLIAHPTSTAAARSARL